MSSRPNKPLIVAAFGARGTGKSAWTKQLIARLAPARLAVWDLMQEYTDLQAFDNLPAYIRALKAPRFAVAFHPSRDDKERERQFDTWCRAMLAAGNLLAVVEELAFVTTPSRAPGPWREMTLLGRHQKHRLSIIGTSQRPASVDKDYIANADIAHCGRLAFPRDAEAVAQVLGVRADELLRLPDLHYIERAAGAADATRGQLSFAAPPATLKRRSKARKLPAE